MVEKEILEMIVKELVDDPKAVSIQEIEGEKSTILELKVATGEVGKVIGRQGAIAKSLRTVISAVSSRHGRRVMLEILD